MSKKGKPYMYNYMYEYILSISMKSIGIIRISNSSSNGTTSKRRSIMHSLSTVAVTVNVEV